MDRKVFNISDAEYRVNEQIRVREVRLITQDNENKGVVPTREALAMATEAGLDLVEVAPNATPPVCRIMDYGKFLYEKRKRERTAKSQQKQIEVKEIQVRPKTDDHHMGFKMRDARRWLEDGMKVKVRIKFRGREIQYPDLARARLQEVAKELEDVAIIEQTPDMEGRSMLLILAPIPDKKKKPT